MFRLPPAARSKKSEPKQFVLGFWEGKMGPGAHLRIKNAISGEQVWSVSVWRAMECQMGVKSRVLRCVFERHDVKSHDHCSKKPLAATQAFSLLT